MQDIYKDLVLYREQENRLVAETESKVKAAYLNQIRFKLQGDKEIKEVVIQAKPASKAKKKLLKLMDDLIREGSQDLFEKALDQVLAELEHQRKEEPSLYLVNQSTGELVMPITEEMIYQPPDFINENGQLQKAKPIVHPKITSSLALKTAKEHNHNKIINKYEGNQLALKALEHLKSPEQIIENARDRLKDSGLTEDFSIDGDEHVIKFGEENIDGVFQSFNPSFQRICLFGAILATRIKKLCSKDEVYWIKNILVAGNQKTQWYEVRLVIQKRLELKEPEQLIKLI